MAIIAGGSYTSTGAARNLNIVSDFDAFELWIQGDATGSNWNSAANPGVTKHAWFFKGMAANSAFTVKNTNGALTDQSLFITANGFTPFSNQFPIIFAKTAVTAVTVANPAQVTSAAHGLSVGDFVRLTNITGMQQISGVIFQVVTVVDANNFTIDLDSNVQPFAAAGTGGFAQRIQVDFSFQPADRIIVPQNAHIGITQAVNAIINTALPHNLTTGAQVRISIPLGRNNANLFGMQEANGLIVTVIAVNSPTEIVTDLNTTGFTAFTYPVSAAFPFTFPQIIPVAEQPFPIGSITTNLANSENNTGFRGITVGSAVVGPVNALVFWKATKYDGLV